MQDAKAIADVLAGSWRGQENIHAWSHELPVSIIESMVNSGAGGLVWHRISRSTNKPPAWTWPLQKAYRTQRFHAIQHEDDLVRVLHRLRGAGVEPIVIKGWSTARYYADSGMRPCGDIDVCVRPDHIDVACQVIREHEFGTGIDLHRGVPDLPDRPWSALMTRSILAKCGSEDVRILGPEDHFRLSCLHFLRHGACRPLWLCDVAVMLESVTADFDWEYCLKGRSRYSQWVISTINLASQLLGARAPSNVPRGITHVPDWLVRCVLKQWSAGRAKDSHGNDANPFATSLVRPGRIVTAMRRRWPNAIEAAIKTRIGPHAFPARWACQLGYFSRRGLRWSTSGFWKGQKHLPGLGLTVHGPTEI